MKIKQAFSVFLATAMLVTSIPMTSFATGNSLEDSADGKEGGSSVSRDGEWGNDLRRLGNSL